MDTGWGWHAMQPTALYTANRVVCMAADDCFLTPAKTGQCSSVASHNSQVINPATMNLPSCRVKCVAFNTGGTLSPESVTNSTFTTDRPP